MCVVEDVADGGSKGWSKGEVQGEAESVANVAEGKGGGEIASEYNNETEKLRGGGNNPPSYPHHQGCRRHS